MNHPFCETDEEGHKRWYIIDNIGRKILHREDGPACEFTTGEKQWVQYGEFHRDDGPAIEYANSAARHWYIRGKRHRIDGPAIEFADGTKEWYYQGKHIKCQSQQEFERLIKLKAFW